MRMIGVRNVVARLKTSGTKKNKVIVPERLVVEILSSLEEFEREEGYLEQKLRIGDLAKKLGTNIKYLSITINRRKNITFNAYINNLRIDHLMDLLERDPRLKNYSLVSLANEVGFNSVGSFTRAFHRVIGVGAAEYVKSL